MRSRHYSSYLHLSKQTNPNPSSSSSFNNLQTLESKTLGSHLSSCPDLKTLPLIHARFLRLGLLLSPFTYNSLMRCYLRSSRPLETLALFAQMRRSNLRPDLYTLPIALKASCHVSPLGLSRQLHSVAIKHGLDRDEYVESGVISLYCKGGSFGSARKVFEGNPERKLGSWNAIVNGLAKSGCWSEVMELFVEMRRVGLVADELTMIGVASACGGLGDLGLGEQAHKLALQVKSLQRLDITLSNSLIDMYCKVGHTDIAHKLFTNTPNPNVSTWTAIITGFATHGQERLALQYFHKMTRQGIEPNSITLISVLNACSHGGLVEQGMKLFNEMKEPKEVHFGCVVDMLGRVGRLSEAREIVERMPMGANAVVYGTLLGASEKHGDVEVGEWAARNLMELEPWNDGVYVVLSNVYAGVGMWKEVDKLRGVMRARRVAKKPGYSALTGNHTKIP